MAYPFADPDPAIFNAYDDALERSYLIDEEYASLKRRPSHQDGVNDNKYWLAIMKALEHLALSREISFEGKIFSDCMCVSYEAITLASLLKFKEIYAVCLHDVDEVDIEVMRKMKYPDCEVRSIVGRFQVKQLQ
jgi:hypothetical protein